MAVHSLDTFGQPDGSTQIKDRTGALVATLDWDGEASAWKVTPDNDPIGFPRPAHFASRVAAEFWVLAYANELEATGH
ncbi:hypothetical protein KEU06_09355 [Pseudaminobacter sp. 19-2017]|uniref:Uncharacterized protein n=1 Tax=Pseudaminobacter soli (ex Zhang et al. 2022) TaxID=2831468 RepID=A0A942DWY8_9HYPH|nr:hypothetical protein [Pseudaminobacter soli]MBS3648811.1 hypothetical protein [Pseudaminobacter soli]